MCVEASAGPGPWPPRPPKLLDWVRLAVCARHDSHRTDKASVGWIRRFLLFHHPRHPAEMGEEEIARFLIQPCQRFKGQRLDPEPGPERTSVPVS